MPQCPFVVLIDSNEGHPYTFQGLKADEKDAKEHDKILQVETKLCSLGRYPHGLGDYSIQGFSDRVAVERKSVEDYWGTVMGWSDDQRGDCGRRQRFKKELENLSKLDAAMVVIEGSLADVLDAVPEWGERPPDQNRRILFRSTMSLIVDYGVQILPCDTRQLAEVATFRFLWDFYRKHGPKKKRAITEEYDADF